TNRYFFLESNHTQVQRKHSLSPKKASKFNLFFLLLNPNASNCLHQSPKRPEKACPDKQLKELTGCLRAVLHIETSLCVRVSSWTGVQQQTLGFFLKGDQILAVNDLRAVNLDEFNMFISKSLKDKVQRRSDSGDAPKYESKPAPKRKITRL
uniref:PDZ domain-containing protein n=1 Tax=Oryzias sinensis TaxID=183150 RepID=A0A8C7X122_9TELE